MMQTPTRADIYAAELKLSQSQRDTRECLVRAQDMTRKGVARLSTLAIVAGVAGLTIMWLVVRRPKAAVVTTSAHMARSTPALGLALAFLLRYGKVVLPFVLEHVRLAQTRHLFKKRPLIRGHSTVDYGATDVLH